MISIKESHGNCKVCNLIDQPSCLIDTNCKDDLSQVEVIFVGENPDKDEISSQIPISGKSGNIFRSLFSSLGLSKLNYLITNTVLCYSDDKIKNDVIDNCKNNIFNIVDACKPKLIVLMGTTPMKAFNIAEDGITKLRGQFYDWNGYKVLLTVNPSFVARNIAKNEPDFTSDLMKILRFFDLKIPTEEQTEIPETKSESIIVDGIFRYKIPEKYYTDEYKLIDIQYLSSKSKVIYIFRDKNGNKDYHYESDDYVYYTSRSFSRLTTPYSKLDIVHVPYSKKYQIENTGNNFESDQKITFKHAQDYYYFNQGEPDIPLVIMYMDIEVYTGKDKNFPTPEEAKYPVTQISYTMNNWEDESKVITYTLNNDRKENVTEGDTKVFHDERQLILHYIHDMEEINPDVITGWNVIGFDLHYVFNRLNKIGLNGNKLSKFSEAYCDFNVSRIAGYVCLDMLILYKNFTFTKLESYSLESVGQEELGEGKIQVSSFAEVFDKDINESIRYNKQDVILLRKLDNKLMHVFLLNEIRKTCSSSFESALSPMNQLDSLIVTFLKNKGIASKASHGSAKDSFEGAYVKPPIVGVHDWIVDFDFTSLYPSIIRTLNVGINTYVMKLKNQNDSYDILYGTPPKQVQVIKDPTFSRQPDIVSGQKIREMLDNKQITMSINGCVFTKHETEVSYYAQILEDLINKRKEAKDQMKDAQRSKDSLKEAFFDTRQQVMKVLANTLYGIIGNPAFRFFDRECARSITLTGQESIKTSMVRGNAYMEKIKKKSKDIPNTEKLTSKELFGDIDARHTPYVITGDTDSMFCCFEDIVDCSKTQDELIPVINEYCKEIQTYLNSDVITKVAENHGVDLTYNKLELKNELIMKRGLFLAKKRYVGYIIFKEGIPVNKTVHMGVETKRSDYPRATKECLKELIDIILKDETVSIDKIMNYVQEKETMFTSLIKKGHQSIARPCSYAKEDDAYKVIPQGVVAMRNWNNLEYDEFSTGSKAYLFKINSLDISKAPDRVIKKFEEYRANNTPLEVIACPRNVETLPEYYNVNYKQMLKFVWQDRYNLLLEPLMKFDEKPLTF